MRVRIEQSGGLAGIVQQLGTIDTDTLPPERARAVQEAVGTVAAAPAEVGADIPTYRVTVTDGDGERTYSCPQPDPDVPPPGLAPLLAELGLG